MKKYTVIFSYEIEVEAENKEEAEKIGSEKWNTLPFPFPSADDMFINIGKRR